MVDYLGMPINDEARSRGLVLSPSVVSMPERQCLYYNPVYLLSGSFGLSISNENDPATGEVIAWHIAGVLDLAIHGIWMDGREPPSDLYPRTVGGRGYGEWLGNTLKVEFPQFKEAYLVRNGIPSSDQTSMTFYINVSGDLMTITAEIKDPVYLTEPQVLSRVFKKGQELDIANSFGGRCTPTVELANLDGTGHVPHFLPGQNPYLNEFAQLRGLPLESILGGAETRYPEYRNYLEGRYQRPSMCPKYCCTPSNGTYPSGCPTP